MKPFLSNLLKTHQGGRIKTFGHSMSPSLLDQDVLSIKKLAFSKVKTNDIIVIKKRGSCFTHRVIYKTKTYLITKGDNNLFSDSKIYSHQVIGKILKINRKGRLFNLEDIYLYQSTLYFKEIIKVKKNLEKSNVNFIFLKGLPLHLYFEDSHPHRLYLDCDLLISSNHLAKVCKIMEDLEYSRTKTNLSTIHTYLKDKIAELSFFQIKNGIPVVFDIHLEVVFMMTQLGKLNSLYSEKLIGAMTDDFLTEKENVKIQGEIFPVLSLENLLVYLPLHFFHHNFRGAFRLQFIDFIIKKAKISNTIWSGIASKIIKYKLQNFVYPSFLLLKKYYKSSLPKYFLSSIMPDSSVLRYIKTHILKVDIFDNEDRISSGTMRFKNLFFLSPRPLWIRLFVFLNLQVVYSISWILQKRLFSLLSIRKKNP